MAGIKPTYEELEQRVSKLEKDFFHAKTAEEALRHRNTIFEAVGFAAERFLWAVSLEDKSLQDVMERLGQATKVSRAYIFQNTAGENNEALILRYKWIDPEIIKKTDNHDLQELPERIAGFERWRNILGTGQLIQGHAKDFPITEQGVLSSQGVLSIIVVPIFIGQEWWGVVAFDEHRYTRTWSAAETEALKIVSKILGGFIQRKRVEEALEQSEERFRLLVQNMPVLVSAFDEEDKFVFWNLEWEKVTGYKADEIIGNARSLELLTPDAGYLQRLREKWAKGDFGLGDWETVIISKDGTPKTISWSFVSNLFPVPGWKHWFISFDVTESKRAKRALEKAHEEAERLVEKRTAELIKANEQLKRENEERRRAEEELLIYQAKLRSLSSELLLTEERERRRIASDLHDRIGHALADSAIKLGSLQKAASPAGFSGELEEVRKIIDRTIQDTSSLTFEISPPMLYDLGLEAAIDWLVEQTQKQHDIRIEFYDDGQVKPLDVSFRVLLFQATRELLFNIVKHAQAKHAKLSVRRDGDDIRIFIEDDGLGFDTSAINSQLGRAKGFGLFSIRERLSHLGGYLEMESEPGKGTQITMVSPMIFHKDS